MLRGRDSDPGIEEVTVDIKEILRWARPVTCAL